MADLSPFPCPAGSGAAISTPIRICPTAPAPRRVVEAYKEAGYDFMHAVGPFHRPLPTGRSPTRAVSAPTISPPSSAPSCMRRRRGRASSGISWPPACRSISRRRRRRRPAPELARRAAAAGAFVGIAHPAWSQLTIEDGRAIDVAHAVEDLQSWLRGRERPRRRLVSARPDAQRRQPAHRLRHR